MSSIWNPQDRYILANGAVSANAPLSGDGSNSQPLGLDLKTDNSLSGNGTLTSPLGVVPGYNETVLWSGTATSGDITLSETYKNFEKIGIVHGCTYSYTDRGLAPDSIFDVDAFLLYNCGQICTTDMSIYAINPTNTTGISQTYETFVQFSAVNDTKLHFNPAKVCFINYPKSDGTLVGRWVYENSRRYFKIYGINRKQ